MLDVSHPQDHERLKRRLLEFLDRYCRDRSLTLHEAAEWFDESFRADEPSGCGS
jgi:hypothetical protein